MNSVNGFLGLLTELGGLKGGFADESALFFTNFIFSKSFGSFGEYLRAETLFLHLFSKVL